MGKKRSGETEPGTTNYAGVTSEAVGKEKDEAGNSSNQEKPEQRKGQSIDAILKKSQPIGQGRDDMQEHHRQRDPDPEESGDRPKNSRKRGPQGGKE